MTAALQLPADPPFTAEGLARRWRVSPAAIRQMCRAGDLPFFRVGRFYRIPAAAVLNHEGGATQGKACNSPDTGADGAPTGANPGAPSAGRSGSRPPPIVMPPSGPWTLTGARSN